MTESGAHKLMGGTMVPNIVLWPASALFVTCCATLGGLLYQDRDRISAVERSDAQQTRDISVNRKDIDNLMSMWSRVDKTMTELDRKMERLMP